jgi:antitoxin VapB
MTISIKDPLVDKLAREVAANMHGTITQAVLESLREKLDRQKRQHGRRKSQRLENMLEIVRRCASMPVHDHRSADEILGYDENGLPT